MSVPPGRKPPRGGARQMSVRPIPAEPEPQAPHPLRSGVSGRPRGRQRARRRTNREGQRARRVRAEGEVGRIRPAQAVDDPVARDCVLSGE